MNKTDFMGSKAKGTDNPVGLNCFRMCAFHQFLYISTAFVLVLFLASSYYSGCLSGAKEKMAV